MTDSPAQFGDRWTLFTGGRGPRKRVGGTFRSWSEKKYAVII